MEVESSGAAKVNAPKNKLLVAILGIFGVLIVGLVIAIVVVKNLPKEKEEIAKIDVPATEYYAASNNVWSEIVNNNSKMNDKEILALYEKKIQEAVDENTKLMLTMEYYGFVMAYDTEGLRKEEIMNAMLSADEKLKTPLSASNIISMAITYNDQELEEEYESILNERISQMEGVNE